MEVTYEKSLAEAYKTIEYLEYSEYNKISKKFIEFLYKNMDMDYYFNIIIDDDFIDNKMSEKAKEIIGLIYRDYLVSSEERDKLLIEENEEQIKFEKELRKKYNPDNLFKKEEKSNIQENLSSIQLMDVSKQPWYKKLFYRALKLISFKK